MIGNVIFLRQMSKEVDNKEKVALVVIVLLGLFPYQWTWANDWPMVHSAVFLIWVSHLIIALHWWEQNLVLWNLHLA